MLWLSNRPGVIRPEPMELMSWEEGCQNVPNRHVQVLLKEDFMQWWVWETSHNLGTTDYNSRIMPT